MSHDNESEITYSNKFKSIVCRASECIHRDKDRPLCNHDWIELDSPGFCIFFKRREIKDFEPSSNPC